MYLPTAYLLPQKQGGARREGTLGLDKTPLYWKSTAKGFEYAKQVGGRK